MRLKHALLLAALLLSLPLRAQLCIETDTPLSCYQKFVEPMNIPAVTNSVGNMAAKVNTGSPDLTKLNNSSLRDFLSIFTAAFQTATLEEDEDGALVLDYNLPIDLMNDNDVVKLQTKFAQPDLNADLKTALATNSGAITTLSDSLDEADDITVSATYSPVNQRFGRSLAQHRPLIEALVTGVSVKRGDGSLVQRAAKFGNALAKSSVFINENQAFSNIPAAERQAVIDAMMDVGRTAKAQFDAQEKVIVAFAELLSNQEQIYFSGSYRDRDPLAGASSSSIKATYELGGKNLSKFLKADGGKCDSAKLVDGPSKAACLDAFNTYIGNNKLRFWRLAATLDLQDTHANTISLPELTAPLTSAKSRSHIASLTAGRRLDDATSSREKRIDITGSYEDVTDDPNRDDRLVLAFTYTQELSDSVTLPITVTYANKEKFLVDVDEKFGVHFGISYKLPQTNK